MPDTGASQTIVSADMARDAKLIVYPTMTELRNASNTVMHLFGESEVVLCKNKHSEVSTVLVTSNLNHAALISWQDLQQLHVIPKTFPAVATVTCKFNKLKTQTIAAFPVCFLNKPTCAQKMIYLKENSALLCFRSSPYSSALSGTRQLRNS